MGRQVAFLRGINVGGHTVKMETLRECFEGLGYRGVSTLIASGNVLFEGEEAGTPDHERRIDAALLEALGYTAEAFVRSSGEIAEIAAYSPFPDMEVPGHTVHVVFLHEPPHDGACAAVKALNSETDAFHQRGRELYWLCRTRVSESPVFKRGLLDKALGVPTTARNMNTIRRVAQKLA